MNSHDNDKSKTLTYAEINSVVGAVKTAPTVPGSEIRRNLLDHDSPTKSIKVQLKSPPGYDGAISVDSEHHPHGSKGNAH